MLLILLSTMLEFHIDWKEFFLFYSANSLEWFHKDIAPKGKGVVKEKLQCLSSRKPQWHGFGYEVNNESRYGSDLMSSCTLHVNSLAHSLGNSDSVHIFTKLWISNHPNYIHWIFRNKRSYTILTNLNILALCHNFHQNIFMSLTIKSINISFAS